MNDKMSDKVIEEGVERVCLMATVVLMSVCMAGAVDFYVTGEVKKTAIENGLVQDSRGRWVLPETR